MNVFNISKKPEKMVTWRELTVSIYYIDIVDVVQIKLAKLVMSNLAIWQFALHSEDQKPFKWSLLTFEMAG